MKKGFTPKGFTIIELVVVIAIVAILSAIVMINVSGYINKSKDAAIKVEMRGFSMCAIEYNISNPGPDLSLSYDNCMRYVDSINSKTSKIDPGQDNNPTGSYFNYQYNDPDSGWCYSAALNDGTYWCVDSEGFTGDFPAGFSPCGGGGPLFYCGAP